MNPVVASMSLPQAIAEHLRGLIHRGELSPGDRLPSERELAEQLSVARISLREAIKLLQDDGYVEVRRGAKGGAFVTELVKPFEEWRTRMRKQVNELSDITDYRIALETRAAALAAERRTRNDLAAMRRANHKLEQCSSRAGFRLADSQFHEAVAKASGNTRLENSIHHTRGELFSPYDVLDYVEPVQESLCDHTTIYSAIRDKDSEQAAERMHSHVQRTQQQLWFIVFGTLPEE